MANLGEDEYYENVFDEEWPFVFENLGRRAYFAMYRAARKVGMTPLQAKNFCSSKFARHNEDEIQERFYKALLPLVRPYKEYAHTYNEERGKEGKKLGKKLRVKYEDDRIMRHLYVEPTFDETEEGEIIFDKPDKKPLSIVKIGFIGGLIGLFVSMTGGNKK